MNNTINRTKKRADILTEYIVERVERLEKKNRYLEDELRHEKNISGEVLAEVIKYRAPFRKVLENVKSVSKCNKGEIEIIVNGQLCPQIYPTDPLYPLAEKLLEEYNKKVEFEKSLEKARHQIRTGSVSFLPKGE